MNFDFESLNDFIATERSFTESFRVRHLYVDIVNHLTAGILLSQIIYWYSPSKNNSVEANKLRVKKEGYKWIAKERDGWWDEIRLSKRQYDLARNKLIEADLIEVRNYKFNGYRTQHIRLKEDVFLEKVRTYLEEKHKKGVDNSKEGQQKEGDSKEGSYKSVEPVSQNRKTEENTDMSESNETAGAMSQNGETEKDADMSGSNESVTPVSQNRETGLTESVSPLTKTTNNDFKKNKNKSSEKNEPVDNSNQTYQRITPDDLNDYVVMHFEDTFDREMTNGEARFLDRFDFEYPVFKIAFFRCTETSNTDDLRYLNTMLSDMKAKGVTTQEEAEEHIYKHFLDKQKEQQKNKKEETEDNKEKKEEKSETKKENKKKSYKRNHSETLSDLYKNGYR